MDTESTHSHVAHAWNDAGVQKIVDEETRKAVLEATRSLLERVDVKALDEMRKSLDLPAEALGTLIQIHTRKLAESEMAAMPKPATAKREVLPLCTDKLVRPGEIAEITARPQRVAFRPERFFVSDACAEYKGPWWKRLWPWYKAPQSLGASDWLIHDIKIGNRSQFAQAGTIPADMFRSSAIDSFVSFDTAQTAMDVKVLVQYVGACPKGQRFFASMLGTSAD